MEEVNIVENYLPKLMKNPNNQLDKSLQAIKKVYGILI